MSAFLVDTMVLSETFKRVPDKAAYAWLQSADREDVFVSVVSFGEISRGLGRLEHRTGRRAERLRIWIDGTIDEFGERILPLSLPILRRWGFLTWQMGNTNPDLLIAATALDHDLTVVTRNVRHFEPTGVKLLNPYEA